MSAGLSLPVSHRTPALARYRWAVCMRTLAAFAGGYALSAAFAAALGLVCVQWLSMSRADAVMLSTMLSFIVFTVAVLWAFACANARRAWIGIAVPALLLGLLTWTLYGGQA